MPIKNYGVWAAYPYSFVAERKIDDPKSPHIKLFYKETPFQKPPPPASIRTQFNSAINVKSVGNEARLVFWINRRFENPAVIKHLSSLKVGFHALPNDADPKGLDYIRSNILEMHRGRLVEHDMPGEENDIIDYLSPILTQAIASQARIFLYGEPYNDGNGIHTIHMNQGNAEKRFRGSNGVFQDGGLVIAFPDGHWEAVFLAFASQKIHTDDETGHPIAEVDFADLLEGQMKDSPTMKSRSCKLAKGGEVEEVEKVEGRNENFGLVRITAALVNPTGPDGQVDGDAEYVIVENRSRGDVNLNGWALQNMQKQRQEVGGLLKVGRTVKVPVPTSPLSNNGGIITLLDANGLKVSGVCYSEDQARREGNMVFFT